MMPANHGWPWDAGQEELLLKGYVQGHSIDTIASVMGRTRNAIMIRLERLKEREMKFKINAKGAKHTSTGSYPVEAGAVVEGKRIETGVYQGGIETEDHVFTPDEFEPLPWRGLIIFSSGRPVLSPEFGSREETLAWLREQDGNLYYTVEGETVKPVPAADLIPDKHMTCDIVLTYTVEGGADTQPMDNFIQVAIDALNKQPNTSGVTMKWSNLRRA